MFGVGQYQTDALQMLQPEHKLQGDVVASTFGRRALRLTTQCMCRIVCLLENWLSWLDHLTFLSSRCFQSALQLDIHVLFDKPWTCHLPVSVCRCSMIYCMYINIIYILYICCCIHTWYIHIYTRIVYTYIYTIHIVSILYTHYEQYVWRRVECFMKNDHRCHLVKFMSEVTRLNPSLFRFASGWLHRWFALVLFVVNSFWPRFFASSARCTQPKHLWSSGQLQALLADLLASMFREPHRTCLQYLAIDLQIWGKDWGHFGYA